MKNDQIECFLIVCTTKNKQVFFFNGRFEHSEMTGTLAKC